MPHDVIMPALGMAQDEGLIVAWLKQPGEAVAEGEALMEVETDKATMEVEAQASGYLTDVRAGAGDSVPVGQCVAVIADSPDAIRVDAAPAPAPEPGPRAKGSEEAADALPEGHDVIMPALGMAQDSGLIVAWHAEPGAELAEGDVLLEVETDKATMEVEADRAGFLAAILAEAGDDVPVGQRIAILTESAPDAPLRRAMAQAPDASPPPAPEHTASATEAPPAPAPAPGPRATATPTQSGRILASPKARRLAAEQGLDLADLVAAGHPQPFHVADLDVLRALPKAAAAPAVSTAAVPGTMTAEVPAEALDAFRDWFAAEHGAPPEGARLFAGFAAGALRAATGAASITVAAGTLGPTRAMADPDRAPLATAPEDSDAPPALILRDLSASRLTAIAPGAGTPPVLTLTRRNNAITLHLTHDEGALPQEAALALLDGVAARIAQPLRHLL